MQSIAIVDFGGQYAHLIARRIRENGVYSEIIRPSDFHFHERFAGVIFSGGPRSVNDADLLSVGADILSSSVPVLGICYGHQLIARLLGGKIERHQFREYGKVALTHGDATGILSGTPETQTVWMSHGDTVTRLPEDILSVASTATTPIAAFRHAAKEIYGLQFHPEVTHSQFGSQILRGFVDRCTTSHDWNMEQVYHSLLEQIRIEAKGRTLLTLISGGVDSLVALALCVKAVGPEMVRAIHVDTGFMRKNESESVMAYLEGLGFQNTKLIDAKEKFFARLEGKTEPEEKRKIIGSLFVEVMEDALAGLPHGGEWMLVQGTIYPDTIESGGTEQSSAIKTHHNRVKEIEELIQQGRVVEPLREFYKDEVRIIASFLDLPEHLILRKPFPGPGLAIRELCDDGSEAGESPTEESGLSASIAAEFGYHAAILPVKSVGVQGDSRTYRHPVLIYPASEGPLNWENITACASRLVNTLHTINRVVFSPVTELPVLTRKKTLLTIERIDLLREVDGVVQNATARLHDIWQFPVIALPLYDATGKQTFVLRPVMSFDAMTADVYPMEETLLSELHSKISGIDGAGTVLYDVTTKPPSTIEWE